MEKDFDAEYNKKISERIIQILDYAGLEVKGIAVLTGRSIDIFYAIINYRRPLSQELATIIGESLNFDGSIIFNLNTPVPSSIKNSQTLQQFRKDNIHNKDFFIDSWSENKDSTFIEKQLINTGYFNKPRYAWEVNEKLKSKGRKLNSDLLSKQLKYFVKKGMLKSKRVPIKLKSGGFGKREVDVYFVK